MRKRVFKGSRNTAILAAIAVSAIGYIMLRDRSASDGTLPAGPAGEAPGNGIALTGVSNENDNRQAPGVDSALPPQTPAAASTAGDRQANRFAEGRRFLELGSAAEAQNDLLLARTQYSQAVRAGLPTDQNENVVARLTAMADDMLFTTGRRHPGDSLVSIYVVQPGDNLERIARRHHVTARLLARINGLADINKIRAGQSLKVLQGPFHCHIIKHSFDMHVYLQDTLVRHYRVGLGLDGSTPTGEWVVSNKLVNPTYYDPRGNGIIQADDPANPLGERWLGLDGISGEAVGQLRYGIHGTNDPPSIGHSVSLGCVRLLNEDVGWLYDMLVTRHSHVFIYE